MHNLLVLPIILPLLFAVSILAFCNRLWVIRGMGLLACGLNFAIALRLLGATWYGDTYTLPMGDWPAPYGIVITIDLLSALMLTTTSLLALLISLFAHRGLEERRERRFFHPLMLLLVMGVNMSFLTGDLFNLFVAFEVMLIASYGLLSLGAGSRKLRSVYLYLTLNIASGTIFLFAAGLIYSLLGTLNMADMAMKVHSMSPRDYGVLLFAVMMLLVVFGGKAAMFPLFFWLPHSYGAAATPIVALFAGMLTKVGVYAMIRVLGGVFGPVFEALQPFVLTLAGLTMVLGVVGAVAQTTIKRILSFHIISQIGYMIMGIALLTPATMAGAVFFTLHNMLVKTGLLLVGGIVEMRRGTDKLDKLGGMWVSDRWLGVLFLLLAMSLAGLPPFTGFWGKLMLIRSGFQAEAYGIVAVSILTSTLTLFSMLKIWNYVFWREDPAIANAKNKKKKTNGKAAAPKKTNGQHETIYGKLRQPAYRQWSAAAFLAIFATVLGFAAEPIVAATRRAATGVFKVEENYEAVVGQFAPSISREFIEMEDVVKPGDPILPSNHPIIPLYRGDSFMRRVIRPQVNPRANHEARQKIADEKKAEQKTLDREIAPESVDNAEAPDHSPAPPSKEAQNQ